VPFAYDKSPVDGPLRQGELLGPLWEHRPLVPPIEVEDGTNVQVFSVHHRLMVVMTPDCDLIWDFQARFETEEARAALEPESDALDTAVAGLPHVLLCDSYPRADIKERLDSKLFKLASSNRDERYHYFAEAEIGEGSGERWEEVYLDFKKPLALPTRQLYEGIKSKAVRRIAWIPLVYRHDLIHRFFGFQSRIATPAD
jgi:hypothetical protein